MKKVFFAILMLVIISAFVSPVFADSGIGEFVKGNDPDDPLKTDVYVAKTFKDVNVPILGETNVRIKVERENEIDNWSHAEYKFSTGLEF